MSWLGDWLDIRPQEKGRLWRAVLGAFLIMGFLVLARALRESLYLTTFPVSSLPYITAGVALASLPAVGGFTWLLARFSPQRVLLWLTLLLMAGLLFLGPLATQRRFAVVLFYLWTALGTMLLTSGFWVVTAEAFAVRGAKRLFGLIGAGGTAGTLFMGLSLGWMTQRLPFTVLALLLVALLGVYLLLQFSARRPTGPRHQRTDASGTERSRLLGSLGLVWQTPYLRTLATIVGAFAVVGTLLDFQFKELAQARSASPQALAGFLGAFYGWAGGVALLLQLLVAGRLIMRAGIAWSIALLPLTWLLGSAVFLAVPSLLVITLVRGAHTAQNRSLGRTILEFLWVPMPADLRRQTKTTIDSVVDSLGAGFGAAMIFLWVTLAHLPSHLLSLFVMAFCLGALFLARRMGKLYFQNIVFRLQEGGAEEQPRQEGLAQETLISGVFTRLDLANLTQIEELKIPGTSNRADGTSASLPAEAEDADRGRQVSQDSLTLLRSPDNAQVAHAMAQVQHWDDAHLAQLIRLLARDALYRRVLEVLTNIGAAAVDQLSQALQDEQTDFVIRRRIPAALVSSSRPEAEQALLKALTTNRFEIRYRAALALSRRQDQGVAVPDRDGQDIIWQAIRREVTRERPVWELQRLLDDIDESDDALVVKQVEMRGALSLAHTFRMLSLVLDPKPVQAAFQGLLVDDGYMKGYALEYLEQALPPDIRRRLWVFIGDISESRRRKDLRPLDKVASDLMATRATLFAGEEERKALRRLLKKHGD